MKWYAYACILSTISEMCNHRLVSGALICNLEAYTGTIIRSFAGCGGWSTFSQNLAHTALFWRIASHYFINFSSSSSPLDCPAILGCRCSSRLLPPFLVLVCPRPAFVSPRAPLSFSSHGCTMSVVVFL